MNTQVQYALDREGSLSFHHRQGQAWLLGSAQGKHSTPVAYAAFEFRLALERIALEFLVRVQGVDQTKAELLKLRSFKSVEKRIYRVAGHQREIDRGIQFMNLVLGMAGAKFTLAQVDVGRLSKYWHECSDFCHIYFTIASVAANEDLVASEYSLLREVDEYLNQVTSSIVSWSQPKEPWFRELQQGFISGRIGESEITAKLTETGIWGLYTAPDGTNTFVSELELGSR